MVSTRPTSNTASPLKPYMLRLAPRLQCISKNRPCALLVRPYSSALAAVLKSPDANVSSKICVNSAMLYSAMALLFQCRTLCVWWLQAASCAPRCEALHSLQTHQSETCTSMFVVPLHKSSTAAWQEASWQAWLQMTVGLAQACGHPDVQARKSHLQCNMQLLLQMKLHLRHQLPLHNLVDRCNANV